MSLVYSCDLDAAVNSPCLGERHGPGVRKHPEGEMITRREGHRKPQSPARKKGYFT